MKKTSINAHCWANIWKGKDKVLNSHSFSFLALLQQWSISTWLINPSYSLLLFHISKTDISAYHKSMQLFAVFYPLRRIETALKHTHAQLIFFSELKRSKSATCSKILRPNKKVKHKTDFFLLGWFWTTTAIFLIFFWFWFPTLLKYTQLSIKFPTPF